MVVAVIFASFLAFGDSSLPVIQEIRPQPFAASSSRVGAEASHSVSITAKRALRFSRQEGFLIFTEGLPNTIATPSSNLVGSEDARCAPGIFVAEEEHAVAVQVVLSPRPGDQTGVSVATEYVAWRRGWIAKIMSKHSTSGHWLLKPHACATIGHLERLLIDDLRRK